MEVQAVELAEDAVFQDACTTDSGQPRNKKNKGAKGNDGHDSQQDHSGDFEGVQRFVSNQNLVPPSCADNTRRRHRNWSEGTWSQAKKTEASVFIGVGGDQLEV